MNKCDQRLEDCDAALLAQVEQRCHSEQFSHIPMLGPEQSLKAVIDRDGETLARFGISSKQIGQRMQSLMQRARASQGAVRFAFLEAKLAQMMGQPPPKPPQFRGFVAELVQNPQRPQQHWSPQHLCEAEVDDRGQFLVDIVSWGGSQECPFKVDKHYHGYRYGADDVLVVNLRTKESLTFSSLLPHMIAKHGFFEGQGLYRVDPERLIRVLNIQPGESYKVPSERREVWTAVQSSSSGALLTVPEPKGEPALLTVAHRIFLQDQHLLAYPRDATDGADVAPLPATIFGASITELKPGHAYQCVKKTVKHFLI